MCGKEEDRWLSLITRGMTTLTRAKRTSRIVSFLMVFGITPSSTTSFTPDSACSKIALINLDISSEGLHLLDGHLNQSLPHQGVDAVYRSVVQPRQLSGRQTGKICCKVADHSPKSNLRNM